MGEDGKNTVELSRSERLRIVVWLMGPFCTCVLAILGLFWRTEHRLTTVETTQQMIVNELHYIRSAALNN